MVKPSPGILGKDNRRAERSPDPPPPPPPPIFDPGVACAQANPGFSKGVFHFSLTHVEKYNKIAESAEFLGMLSEVELEASKYPSTRKSGEVYAPPGVKPHCIAKSGTVLLLASRM